MVQLANAYLIFHIMEEVKRHLNVLAINKCTDTTKKDVLQAILKTEDLLFQWTLMLTSADTDHDTGLTVLERIPTLYITGFSFANSCLEMYKLEYKNQIQKSKVLWKKIQPPQNDDDQ